MSKKITPDIREEETKIGSDCSSSSLADNAPNDVLEVLFPAIVCPHCDYKQLTVDNLKNDNKSLQEQNDLLKLEIERWKQREAELEQTIARLKPTRVQW